MAKWLAKEFDWDTGRYTGNYYDIAEAGIVAVFVDSFYGLDTNAGTAAAPFKTLGAAITYLNANGADGSRIFMNGVFSETLPAQTYWYEFIGCGGGKNGRTVFYFNESTSSYVNMTKEYTRWHNVQTINYKLYSTELGRETVNVYPNFLQFVNCLISNTFFRISNFTTTNQNVLTYYSVFFQCKFGIQNPRIIAFSSIIYDCTAATVWTISGNNYYHFGSQVPNSLFNTHISNIIAQFINPANNDYNVRITSPLLQAGTVDEITGIAANVGGVEVGLPYNGITPEFTTEGGATITDLTIDSLGKFTITAPATTGTLETALMDLGNIYPLENIDLFNVFDFASGEITQGVFEDFVSPRMALTIKLKYGLTSAEVDDCPWLLIEYGKQPTYSGSGASRVGNADDTFDPDTFQEITCRYMKLFITLQNNS